MNCHCQQRYAIALQMLVLFVVIVVVNHCECQTDVSPLSASGQECHKNTNKDSLYICLAGRTNCHNQDNTKEMVDAKRVLSYEDMLEIIHEPKKVIIDVRDPDEIASTGKIPSSINIPLPNVHDTLACMSDEDFRCRFKRGKPTRNDDLIFYCRSGRRASEALDTALKLGYKNSKNYKGSWSEWSSKQQ